MLFIIQYNSVYALVGVVVIIIVYVFTVMLNFLALCITVLSYKNYLLQSALQDQQLLSVILCNPLSENCDLVKEKPPLPPSKRYIKERFHCILRPYIGQLGLAV